MTLLGWSKKSTNDGDKSKIMIKRYQQKLIMFYQFRDDLLAKENSSMIHHWILVHLPSIPSGQGFRELHLAFILTLAIIALNPGTESAIVGSSPKINAQTVVSITIKLKIVGSQGEEATRATKIPERVKSLKGATSVMEQPFKPFPIYSIFSLFYYLILSGLSYLKTYLPSYLLYLIWT